MSDNELIVLLIKHLQIAKKEFDSLTKEATNAAKVGCSCRE